MRKKFIKSITTLSIMSLCLSFGGLKANAETKGTLTIQEKNEISNIFREEGLEANIISNLIDKLDNGDQIDSMNPEKEPISKEISTNISGEQVEKVVYEDGSYAVTSISMPQNRESVSGGSTSSGSGYQSVKGAKVYHSTGTITTYFYVDFTYVTGGKSYISKVYDYKINVTLGYYSLESFGIVKKNQDLNGPATASLNFGVTRMGDIFSSSHKLTLTISSYNASAKFS